MFITTAAPLLGTGFCIGYFSFSVIEHPDKSTLGASLVLLTAPEDVSMVEKVRQ